MGTVGRTGSGLAGWTEAAADPTDFVRRNTAIGRPPLVPEIALHLATEVTPIWQATEESLSRGAVPPPFWAFAWAGGQALARYVLDNPEIVRGREVLDIGSGSGIVAIAAAMAGARRVVAAEIDPFAAAAIGLNAALNGIAISWPLRRPPTTFSWSATCSTSVRWPSGCSPSWRPPGGRAPRCWSATRAGAISPTRASSRWPNTRCR